MRIVKFLLPVVTAVLFTLVGCMSEVTQAEYTEGKQYSVIDPPIALKAPTGQHEVSEIFWYGCPHCFSLEPTIKEYLKTKPANVFFNRIPGTLGETWDYHAKLYYIGYILDRDGAKDLHGKIFNAAHVQRRPLPRFERGNTAKNDDNLRRFFESFGYTADEINKAMSSMELNSLLSYARDANTKSGIDSVPSIIVNGKYLTGPSRMTGSDKLIDVINYLTKLPR
ncbi:thiol:disulfide interchange protein DsbA/DsbL [Thiothrix eikelboomii]|uniref:thiol:disulfide interchange protein DsbA/DsbL n=1 Tax=Thiothrix eikelboomii TaxID=92487 RepID=UPI003BAFF6BA